MQLQSSANSIQRGLDLWRATVARYQTDGCDHVPWKNAKDLYATIDSISVGGIGWTTYHLTYGGLLPTGTVPQWMRETYELNVRDVLSVFEEQLASKEFDGQFSYTPYEEYDKDGSRVFSNLMSGDWASCQAVCTSTFYVHLSDKWQGHDLSRQEYAWINVCSNRRWQRQDNGISCNRKSRISSSIRIARQHHKYRPACTRKWCSSNCLSSNPKRFVIIYLVLAFFVEGWTVSSEQAPAPAARISDILPPALSERTRIGLCPTQAVHDSAESHEVPRWALLPHCFWPWTLHCRLSRTSLAHWCCIELVSEVSCVINFAFGVTNAYVRCDAPRTNLDDAQSHQRSHEKTDILVKTFDPNILWDDFGIRHNIVVCNCPYFDTIV